MMKQSKAFSFERVRSGKEEWLTPPGITEALGPFDLDPCSPIIRPWPTATKHYTIEDDGLVQPWDGRIWLNPPYGNKTGDWIHKLRLHGNGIALVFARTETRFFHRDIWGCASGLFWLKGRIKFFNADGSPTNNCGGAPSVLIAYGANNVEKLKKSGLAGHLTLERE